MEEQLLYGLGREAIMTYTSMVLGMDIEGRERLPAGPKIIAANHPTTTDPFYLLAITPEQMHILITEMCFKVPVFGEYLRRAGHVPVTQENGRAALDAGVDILRAGGTLGIFPEGALSPRVGALGRPRTGTARLALLTGAPVVPVGIALRPQHVHCVDTTVEDMSAEARWYPLGPYAMTVGEPVRFGGDVQDWDRVRDVSAEIMRRIGQLTQESARRLADRPAGLVEALVGMFGFAGAGAS